MRWGKRNDREVEPTDPVMGAHQELIKSEFLQKQAEAGKQWVK